MPNTKDEHGQGWSRQRSSCQLCNFRSEQGILLNGFNLQKSQMIIRGEKKLLFFNWYFQQQMNTRYAFLKCSAQSRLNSFKLGFPIASLTYVKYDIYDIHVICEVLCGTGPQSKVPGPDDE